MNIVHICNNYISSKVHENLIFEISKKYEIFQSVFIPVRDCKDIGKNHFSSDRVDFIYFNYFFKVLKFFPILKIFIISIFFFLKFNKKENDFIICHNFWSDGMVAFFVNMIKKTPYVVVVRNTDMNVFLPKLIHYRWLMRLMVKNSQGLIFVNNTYKEKFKSLYPSLYSCAKKVKVIPNGVDDFWLNNCIKNKSKIIKKNTIVYVGVFNENKNIKGTFLALEKCRERNLDINACFVGGSEDDFKKLLNISKIPNYIQVVNKTNDKSKILEIYRESKIFIMPSFFETFGLVYIEALLQGCAIIHSKGQGIDGMINSDLVCGVDPFNIYEISEKIEYLLNVFEGSYMNNTLIEELVNEYNWNNVSNQYLSYVDNREGNM